MTVGNAPDAANRDWLEIRVDAPEWRATFEPEALAERAAAAALASADIPAQDVEISLLLTDDDAIATMNKRFRGLDKPTNVLSWPSTALSGPVDAAALRPAPYFLGDVALAYQTTRNEAEAASNPLEAHVAHLIIHGVLHLLGHRHDNDAEAAQMEAREIWALARLGVVSPYGETARTRTERQDRTEWTDR